MPTEPWIEGWGSTDEHGPANWAIAPAWSVAEVTRLTAEVKRLRAGLADLKAGAEHDAILIVEASDEIDEQVHEIERLRALLERLLQWDHLDGSADGPYWRREIEAVLDRPKSK